MTDSSDGAGSDDGGVEVVRADAPVGELLEDLVAALSGGPALLPLPPGAPGAAAREAAALGEPVDEGSALLLATSGSSGTPQVVELSAAALSASAAGAAAALGGHAQWLLALPLVHVAGWQVLVRSVLAGTEPVVLPRGESFSAGAFAAAAAGMTGARRATSLVPTQLRRVLADPLAREAAATFDAVLVGGAATPPSLLASARDAGVRVVTTYGSTETSGGCVYDGAPLPGVVVALVDGAVRLGGDVLATRYRGAPGATAETFVRRAGRRWYLTPDVGRLVRGGDGAGRAAGTSVGDGAGRAAGTSVGDGGDGGGGGGGGGGRVGDTGGTGRRGPRLVVDGRRDDVVVTGGVNVSPVAVEHVITSLAGVAEALVVGVPDPEWGRALVALAVAAGDGAPDLAAVRRAVAERLGAASAPRSLLVVDALPVTALGKPDRRAAAALASARLPRSGPR